MIPDYQIDKDLAQYLDSCVTKMVITIIVIFIMFTVIINL